jgi:hypothetical protein
MTGNRRVHLLNALAEYITKGSKPVTYESWLSRVLDLMCMFQP